MIELVDPSLLLDEEQFVCLTLHRSISMDSATEDSPSSDQLLDIVDRYLANESDESDRENEVESEMSHFHLHLPQKIFEKQHSGQLEFSH